MTLKRHLLNKQMLRAALPLAGLGIAAAALSGCGGASTSVGGTSAPTLNSGPVIYGINAAAVSQGASVQGETSGLSYTPTGGAAEVVVAAATAYHTTAGAGPLPAYQIAFPNTGTTSSPGLPLGFTSGGVYYNDSTSIPIVALPTTGTGTLVFGAYASAGTFSNNPADINPSSIVLTSTEAPTFSEPLSFVGTSAIGTGVLSQAQYASAPFAVPAFLQTTGLHTLQTNIADVDGQSSSTVFSVLSLAPTDAAALVTVNFTNSSNQTSAVPGAVATISNALPTVAAYQDAAAPTGSAALPLTTSFADAQGTILLFAAPGTQTITVTGVDPFKGQPITGTVQVTLVAGQVNTTSMVATTLVPATTAPAAAIARAKLMQHHLIKQ